MQQQDRLQLNHGQTRQDQLESHQGQPFDASLLQLNQFQEPSLRFRHLIIFAVHFRQTRLLFPLIHKLSLQLVSNDCVVIWSMSLISPTIPTTGVG